MNLIMILRNEEEIKHMIKEIESQCDPDDEYCYLDEGEQATLATLYWVLGEESL